MTDEWAAGLAFTTPAATLSGNGSIQMSEVLGDAQVADAGAVYYDDLDADNGLPAQLRAGLGWQRPGVGGFGIDATHHWARDYDWMSGGSGDDALAIRQSRRAVTDLQVGGEYVSGNAIRCAPARSRVFRRRPIWSRMVNPPSARSTCTASRPVSVPRAKRWS